WLRKRTMAMTTGKERGWRHRVRVFSAAWRRWRQHSHPAPRILLLLDAAAYYVLWVVEAIAVVSTLCFFYLRFGFRL
ncbi:hypothetical protein GW17_00020977, partial [Ensete ventricosum]